MGLGCVDEGESCVALAVAALAALATAAAIAVATVAALRHGPTPIRERAIGLEQKDAGVATAQQQQQRRKERCGEQKIVGEWAQDAI
jgi:uncharacterized low-complexity protein